MNEKQQLVLNESQLFLPVVLVIAVMFLIAGISLYNSHNPQPVDPVIEYLQEQQPTQPFGGAEETFVNHPPLHKASTRLMLLRKLHLVRPDLIPYPLDIRVYA